MGKKIAILTSGGDAPGMNNAIRAVVKAGFIAGFEPYLVYQGYKGLVEDQIEKANLREFDDYVRRGGTKIYSARLPEFKELTVRQKAVANLKRHGINFLVVIGGDGSYRGALKLSEMGVKTIALPGTIDNDIASSDFTIGYFTALNTAIEAIERIADTARSHKRIMIVELMGRYCGDLAVYAAMATGAHIVITSENKVATATLIERAKQAFENGAETAIIIVSEHLYNVADEAQKIGAALKITTRAVVLGHLQRGGSPVASDRILATKMGFYAVELLKNAQTGFCIGYKEGRLQAIEIAVALKMQSRSRRAEIALLNKVNLL